MGRYWGRSGRDGLRTSKRGGTGPSRAGEGHADACVDDRSAAAAAWHETGGLGAR